jgi:hypothetical protein
MEILVAILIIALIAAVAFAVIQRRPGAVRGLGGPRTARAAVRTRRPPRNDPMAAAVVEHAQAIEPAEVVVAEQRLKAQARQVAAGMQADANQTEHQRAADRLADPDPYVADPRVDADGYADPATDPRYADPEYVEPAPADDGDPRRSDRRRRR